MADTKIEWAEKVWNPIAGCTKCSPGCENCYAERMAHRLARMGKYGYNRIVHDDGGWNGLVFPMHDKLDIPLHWRQPRRIFICSMSDLFHPKVPFEFIDKVFAAATLCPQHTFLILTKRIDRALEYVLQEPRGHIDHAITDGLTHFVGRGKKYAGKGLTKHLRNKNQLWPLDNVHFGASISNQPEADKIIPILLQIPAAAKWLSIEPMLGDIEYLASWLVGCSDKHLRPRPTEARLAKRDRNLRSIGWVVVGSESGPGARYCPIENIRSIVEQCKAASAPVFVKQIHLWQIQGSGGWLFETEKAALESAIRRHLDFNNKIAGKKNKLTPKRVLIKDMSQFPKDLRIQQYPKRS